MLTKEEAKRFREEIDSYNFSSQSIDHIFDTVIKKFTEKPKREIRIGDIYLAEGVNPQLVINLEDNKIITFSSAYDLSGKWVHCEDGPHSYGDLDLSERYRLVRMQDD